MSIWNTLLNNANGPQQTTKGVQASSPSGPPSVQNSPHLGGGSMGPNQGPALGQALANRQPSNGLASRMQQAAQPQPQQQGGGMMSGLQNLSGQQFSGPPADDDVNYCEYCIAD